MMPDPFQPDTCRACGQAIQYVPTPQGGGDAATGRDVVGPPAAEPARAAGERHRVGDVVAIAGLTVLAVVGTLISLVLYGADVPGPLLVAWVLVMDLGVKLLLIVAVWSLFLRRGRADRLDY